jgi:hypothetical protein
MEAPRKTFRRLSPPTDQPAHALSGPAPARIVRWRREASLALL